MAKIKFGMMMTDARGKLGGHVFTKTRSGATVRTKVTPVNPQSSAQGNVRTTLGTFAQNWNVIDESKRQLWNAFAAQNKKTNVFGDLYAPTGRSLYIGVNINLATAGAPSILEPVPPVPLPSYKLSDVVASSSANEIDATFIDYSTLTGQDVLIVEATPLMSAGRYNFSGAHAIIGKFIAPDLSLGLDLTNQWHSKYGALVAGNKIDFRVYTVRADTGQVSSRQSFTTIVL